MKFDLAIKNVRIIDGTNSPWSRGDVGICDGKIMRIGRVKDEETAKIVDGEDKYLAPGFIDIHSHSDCTLPDNRFSESRILQGITTEIGGDCGLSMAPVNKEKRDLLRAYMGDYDFTWDTMKEFLDYVESEPISVNFGTAVGHGTIRIAAMGFDNRKPTPEEMKEMQRYLKESLDGGAFCMSSGLIYPPGCYSDLDEMVEMAKILKDYGSFYETHMRGEGLNVEESVAEAIEVCRRSGMPLQIAHHKVIRKEAWRVSCKKTIAMVEKARREGLDVTMDQYPYRASATTLDCNVPEWAFEGGVEELLNRLRDEKTRQKIKEEIGESHKGRWGDIFVGNVESEKNKWVIGKSIVEIAETRGVSPEDACLDLILEEKSRVNEIHFGMCEEDIEFIMKRPFVMVGSDGNSLSLDTAGLPHPRSFGTFPRVLSHYCRERELISPETAVHKMTGMPASRLGIQDRGLIKEGMWADLVLFDFDKINDTPTFDNPKCPCEGIRRVYVNGVLTAVDGKHTKQRAGKVLRKAY